MDDRFRQAEQKGPLFGWMFHYRVVEDIPGPGYLITMQFGTHRRVNWLM